MSPVDNTQFAPGTLIDHGEGHYSLIYSRFPAYDDIFTPKGLPGGGFTWRGMVVHLLEEQAPDALESLEFDPETSMFCAVSDSLAALRAVAKVLAQLEDREVVLRIVEHVDLTQYD